MSLQCICRIVGGGLRGYADALVLRYQRTDADYSSVTGYLPPHSPHRQHPLEIDLHRQRAKGRYPA